MFSYCIIHVSLSIRTKYLDTIHELIVTFTVKVSGEGTVRRAGTNSTVWESAAAAGQILDAACWNGLMGAGQFDPQLDFAAAAEAGGDQVTFTDGLTEAMFLSL
jgi:hypothetical protein